MARAHLLLPAVVLLGAAATLPAQGTQRVSVDSNGVQGNSRSSEPSISGDGRFVAFGSDAWNLVPGDTNYLMDVFVHDRQTGQTTRVSVDSNGVEGNLWSEDPSISGDGRFVAFQSVASNLVPGDTNGAIDIFVHDRQTGQTTRVSVDSNGVQGNSSSGGVSISGDGRFVAFQSYATNLVPGDTNDSADVFVHDRQTGQTTRVSVDSAGVQGNFDSGWPSISGDGRFVAFGSNANNLVPGDTNWTLDVFVHDRQTGQTTRVSVDSNGAQGNSWSGGVPSISVDGRSVSFESAASNLVPGDTNGYDDVFVHDRQTGQTTRVSVDSNGTQGNAGSGYSSISGDGRFVAFWSVATNLVPGDTNGLEDAFLHDRQTGQTTRVSVDSAGAQANAWIGWWPSISADGRFVVFASEADNLVPGDTNDAWDVFVHGGPVLSSSGACPGVMTFTASGATPGGTVAFVWGTATGGFRIPPGNPCSPLQLDLVPRLTPPPGYVLARANASGVAVASGRVPPGACGRIVLQAVDLATCSLSNRIPL